MMRINLASKSPCPTCGGDMAEAFDGGQDRFYEYCYRTHPVLTGDALKAWWAEHELRCPGPGKCQEGPPVRVCNVEISPPRWLVAALAQGAAVGAIA